MSNPSEACSSNIFRIDINACRQEIEEGTPTLPPALDSRSDIFSILTQDEKQEAIAATAEQDKRLEAAAKCLNRVCAGNSCKYDRAAMEKLGIFRLNIGSYTMPIGERDRAFEALADEISKSLDIVATIAHVQNDPQFYYDLAESFMQTPTEKLVDVLKRPASYKIPASYRLPYKSGEGCETYNTFATAVLLTYYLKGKDAADKLLKLSGYQPATANHQQPAQPPTAEPSI